MSYQSIKQLEKTLIDNSYTQLTYLNNRLDNDFRSVQFNVAGLLYNTDIINYKPMKTESENIKITNELQKVIGASQVMGSAAVYFDESNQMIVSNALSEESRQKLQLFLEQVDQPGWYRADGVSFYYINFYPFRAGIHTETDQQFLAAGKLRQEYIYELLATYSEDKQINCFFNFSDNEVISISDIPESIRCAIDDTKSNEASIEVRDQGKRFHVVSVKNPRTGTRLTTYVDMSILSKNMTNTIISSAFILCILLFLAILIFLLFNFKINRNLQMLLNYLQTAQEGDYKKRIPTSKDTGFNYVFEKYNQMLEQTESLLVSLSEETHLRETAEFRQLQSQINPHFLYNNLLFIMSMAESSPKTVTLMTTHLADYYRYVTKKNTQEVTLGQELHLAESYLTIIALRKEVDFFIDYPENLSDEPFMQLIIQPIVENAVFHGIENRAESKEINIQVQMLHDGFEIKIFDDGKGLTEQEIKKLDSKIMKEMPENGDSVGLWNVNKRLINRYGIKSKLKFESHIETQGYGLTVLFWIPLNNNLKEE